LTNRKSFSSILITAVSILTACIFALPIVWMIFVSLKTVGTPIDAVYKWFIPTYTIENYIDLMKTTGIMMWMWNSVIVALVATFAYLIIASLASFALSVINFRGKKFLYMFFLLGLMIPSEAIIVSLYIVSKNLNLLDSYTGLILPMIAGPMGVIILKTFFDSIPKDLRESAEIDGCGVGRIFFIIYLPLAQSALASVAILTFISVWNNYLWPFLACTSTEMFTLPIGVPTLFNAQYNNDYIIPMTGNAIASIPAIVIFLVFQKQIVKGIALSGIKA